MRLRYGFLCEYARELANGTNMAVGLFDRVSVRRPDGAPFAIAPHVIYVVVEAPSVAPPRHLIALRLIDADAKPLFDAELAFDIGTRHTEGYPKTGNVIVEVKNPIPVPDAGAYEWVVSVDGERLGSIPFLVAEA